MYSSQDICSRNAEAVQSGSAQHVCSLVDFSLIIRCKVKTFVVPGAFLGAEHDKANLEALSCLVRKITAVLC